VVSAALVDLANTDRSQEGLDALTTDPRLTAIAQAKANDMASSGYFAHTSPAGRDPWYWFAQEGYEFVYAGENLAIDFSDSGDVNRAWMSSPSHRANILDAHYTHVGIATAQGMYQGRLTVFVVQVFAAPAAAGSGRIVSVTVPADPIETATAQAVLGASKPPRATSGPDEPAMEPQIVEEHRATMPTITVATTDPAIAAALAHENASRPFWRAVIAYPRSTLQYTYYILGILILCALALETGLELRWHHRKHAARAAVLVVAMLVLFFAADVFFFTKPVLAAVAAAL